LWTGAATMKDPASAIPPPKFALVQKAALAACDANDGVKDGIITNPQACHFDPGVIQCKNADAADCLTAPQVAALRAIYAGPRNPRTGKQIYPGLSVGSEAQMPVLTLGKEPFPVATSFFRSPVFNDPSWTFSSFDYDRDVERAMAYGSNALDVPPTGLKPFFAGHRKLLLSHGWADGLIPSQSTINFYQALVKDIGKQRAQQDVRLFMVPGMGHCGGGSGPSSLDMIGAIDQWVQTGNPPEQIIASNPPGQPQRTRPLCSFPKVATYTGHGDTDQAENFRCETPLNR
jgi:feruloyl esterase